MEAEKSCTPTIAGRRRIASSVEKKTRGPLRGGGPVTILNGGTDIVNSREGKGCLKPLGGMGNGGGAHSRRKDGGELSGPPVQCQG